MNQPQTNIDAPASERVAEMPKPARSAGQRKRTFLIAGAILTAGFALPLYELVRLSFASELHSHLLLIPVVSWYVWRFIDGGRKTGTAEEAGAQHLQASAARAPAIGVALIAVMMAALYLWLRLKVRLPVTEYLWAGILSYLLMALAAAGLLFGWKRLGAHLFAVLFLAFFIPLPTSLTDAMSIVLQRGSAEVADWTLRMTGLPVLRDGLAFLLPGLTIQVAEECSGVRSTLVLFITSLIAGKMFLRSGWKRLVLAAVTLPMGIVRNALRITVLAWLSVNVDPGVIHGPLHHEGGPIFFVISLIPLFALLWYFKRAESRKPRGKEKNSL